jgi:hypothetical protein
MNGIHWPTRRFRRVLVFSALLMLLVVQEVQPYGAHDALLGRVLRGYGFNFVGWEVQALVAKFAQNTAGTHAWLEESERRALVTDYFDLIGRIHADEHELEVYYAQRSLPQADAAEAGALRAELAGLRERQGAEQPFVEAIVEGQITSVLNDQGFATAGLLLPPVSLHFTPLPQMLVISPRDRIAADQQISLQHGLPVEVQEALEAEADRALGARSLVVPIGGLAMYPAMMLESHSLNWVVEAGAHEWVHHWLMLRPLGYNYESHPDTRAINETVASIAGQEIGQAVLARYYPERLGGRQGDSNVQARPPADGFDFAAEMNATRVHVDALLADGRIDEAEGYMERRRLEFVANGYPIRKLNQAYFAFYGGYQAEPGGAAGEDPIGPAVRALRAASPDLKTFLDTVAELETLADVQAALERLQQ